MVSDEATRQAPAQAQPSRRMSKRTKKKLLVATVLVVAAVVLLFWGWSSAGRDYMTVRELVDQSADGIPAKYAGKPVEIRGKVTSWSGSPDDSSFTLVDDVDPSKTIGVTMNGSLPEGFENLVPVVVKGVLASDPPLRITASEITVGCASKY